MTKILYGKEVADNLYNKLHSNIGILAGKRLLLVGLNDEAWLQYAQSIVKSGVKLGVCVENVLLENDVSVERLSQYLKEFSADESVAGILVQQPLPKHLAGATEFVAVEKDVDCICSAGVAKLYKGAQKVCPATPSAVLAMLDYYGIELQGKNVVVIGRGNAVGKPLSLMLLQRNATVTVCHSKSQNISKITHNADIVISACGVPNLVTADYVSADAVVVDVGLSFVDGKTCGDVDNAVYNVCKAVTPVPLGIGPVTRACLFTNLLELVQK